MVIFYEFIMAFTLTLLLSLLLILPLGWRYGKSPDSAISSFIFVFFILLFPIWLIGIWAVPMGPMVGEVSILPPLFGGLLLFLLLLTLIPIRSREEPGVEKEVMGEGARREVTTTAVGTVFWIFLGLALVLTALSYMFPSN